MKEKTGVVFSVAADNQPVAGCTISKEVYSDGQDYISYFSLAKGTDISAEIYSYHKLIILAEGDLTVYTDKTQWQLSEGECIFTPMDIPVGMNTVTKAIYTEISIRRDTMNSIIKSGEVFELAELLPYQEGKIINMDIAHNEKMKFTGLTEHAAPGEALIFALDGSAVIGYEGQEYRIKAGENFKFAAGGKHWVKADGRFKMALLMTLV